MLRLSQLTAARLLALCICLLLAPTTECAPADLPGLFTFRDETGEVRAVRTMDDWLRRRDSIAAAMEVVMGPVPWRKRCPLALRVEEEIDCGSFVRRLISYQSEPTARTPAYLLVPKSALNGDKAPGVICLMPTNAYGNAAVVGLAGDRVPSDHAYGVELAELGFVVIAPPYPLLAGYNPDLTRLGYVSGTMKGIWDNIRALDVLDSLPFVHHGRYGSIGHSLGGHNGIYTAVFEERIKALVSSCGFDSYRDYKDETAWRPGKGWVQTLYMPRLLEYQRENIPFDFHEMIAAIAPRGVFISAPVGDSNFKVESARRVIAQAAEVFAFQGASNRLIVEHPECGHEFPRETRQRAYSFLKTRLAEHPVTIKRCEP